MFLKNSGKLIALCCTFLMVTQVNAVSSWTEEAIAQQLGWVPASNLCEGNFIEQPIRYTIPIDQKNMVEITSRSGLLTKRDTSILEGDATLTRKKQQLTASRIILMRDPKTFKLVAAHLAGNVHVREPNTLILAEEGNYYFNTHETSLSHVVYRTALSGHTIAGPNVLLSDQHKTRRLANMNAWGKAKTVSQTEPKIYTFTQGSFSTCPPIHPAWHITGSRLVINKETGRGSMSHMRFYVKRTPVLYFPYISFSIDHRRKSGFLWPTINLVNSNSGFSVLAPFYWNIAPNYDTTITPAYLRKRGIQLTDQFRYLTPIHSGDIAFTLLPDDRQFLILQEQYRNRYQNSTNNTIQAELNRLLNSSPTRKSFVWQEAAHFSEHLSGQVDYQYAGDDYYLQDFGSNLNEITQNQLLQEGDVYYKAQYWQFTGRIQNYQTLHPITEGQPAVANQYRRLPQLILNGEYPAENGLSYFVNSEVTHFDIRNTPGTPANAPIGNRVHLQPGISFPFYRPSLYLNPRLQLALTDYQLYKISETNTPPSKQVSIPIFDVASGLAFDRSAIFFNHTYQQTIEPQIYYTYIPYRNQSSIPNFDTTVNMLTYDQLFNYNRFSGIDRIGDANQVGMGLTMRLIRSESGIEKLRLGMGEILYFANRLVTLCNNDSCTDNPTNHSNYQRLSPLSGVLDYHLSDPWHFTTNAIWNTLSKQIDNASVSLHYQTDATHVLNLSYNYVWNGNVQSGLIINSTQNNVKLTDFSFAYPVTHALTWVGEWSEDWNLNHLQNILSGVQYESCCWTIQAVGGKTLTQLQNTTPQYQNAFYIQFALKGLGNIGTGSSTDLLNSINGYNMKIGQAF